MFYPWVVHQRYTAGEWIDLRSIRTRLVDTTRLALRDQIATNLGKNIPHKQPVRWRHSSAITAAHSAKIAL